MSGKQSGSFKQQWLRWLVMSSLQVQYLRDSAEGQHLGVIKSLLHRRGELSMVVGASKLLDDRLLDAVPVTTVMI